MKKLLLRMLTIQLILWFVPFISEVVVANHHDIYQDTMSGNPLINPFAPSLPGQKSLLGPTINEDEFDGDDKDPVLSDKRTLLALTAIAHFMTDIKARAIVYQHLNPDIQKLFTDRDSGQLSTFTGELSARAVNLSFLRAVRALVAGGYEGLNNFVMGKPLLTQITEEDLKKNAISYEVIQNHDFIPIQGHIEFPELGQEVDEGWKNYFKMIVVSGLNCSVDALAFTTLSQVERKVLFPNVGALQFIPFFSERYEPPKSITAVNLSEFMMSQGLQRVIFNLTDRVRKLVSLHRFERTGFYTVKDGKYYHVIFRDKTEGELILEQALARYQTIPVDLYNAHKEYFEVRDRVIPRKNWKVVSRAMLEKTGHFLYDTTALFAIYGLSERVFNSDGQKGITFKRALGESLMMSLLMPVAYAVKKISLFGINKFYDTYIAKPVSPEDIPVAIVKLEGIYRFVHTRKGKKLPTKDVAMSDKEGRSEGEGTAPLIENKEGVIVEPVSKSTT